MEGDLCELIRKALQDEQQAQNQYNTMIRSTKEDQRIAAQIIETIREQESAHYRILEALHDLYCHEKGQESLAE